ncbi:MAG: FHA domain-containing protein [Calothrix sp. SM1_7_51]|nr:FHA domain-containing protein [Calothrix sp. SM1_7_51]
MIVCPNCNHPNPDGALQCEACYTPLPATTSCPSCGTSVQADASFAVSAVSNLRAYREATAAVAPPPNIAPTVAPDIPLPPVITPDPLPTAPETFVVTAAAANPEPVAPPPAPVPPTAVVTPSIAPEPLETTEVIVPPPAPVPIPVPETVTPPPAPAPIPVPETVTPPPVPAPAPISVPEAVLPPPIPMPEAIAPPPLPAPVPEAQPTPIAVPEAVASLAPEPVMAPAAAPEPTVARTQLQQLIARLVHVQTDATIELPPNLSVVHIGKPNDKIPPDIDVSGFPNSEIVSRVHADIRAEGDAFYIEDVGSSNGTYINNLPLLPGNRHRLRPGDRISLGKGDMITFLFQIS